MARPDLTAREVEAMAQENPGSAAEYLRLRREELEADRQAEREEDDKERFVEQFVAAGGDRAEALAARKKMMNEQALEATRRADESAVQHTRLHASRSL